MYKYVFLPTLLVILLSGCMATKKTVRPQDVNAWKDIPVEELDIHSFFITLPVIKTKTESGIEIRVYPNKVNYGTCFSNGNINGSGYMKFAQFNSFQNCSSKLVGCDNIFYIKNKKVLEYKPVGNCFTDESVQPEKKSWR